MSALIECGANLHVRDSDGNDALQIATRNGYFEIASILECDGADLDMWE